MLQQGFFRISRPCDDCAGAGEIVRERCPECRGAGRIEGLQSVKVRVPPGVDEGTRLRLTGEGEAGIAGGPPGDLYVVIAMKPHPLFTRDGQDHPLRGADLVHAGRARRGDRGADARGQDASSASRRARRAAR